MINKQTFLMIFISATLLGCSDQRKEDAKVKSEAQPVEVPYITDDNGIKYPYFPYDTYNHPSETKNEKGLAVFIYPIFKIKNKGLALDYMPTDNIKDLFGEELFGKNFSVSQKNDTLVIDSLPISRPLDMKPNSKWKMNYVKEVFECGVVQEFGNEFIVRCISAETSLSLRFNNDRGFTSFQDLCSRGVCTYNLKSSVGLLSPYHLRVISQ
jgi:hypothetical protein